jgi:hypothetical protein
MAEEKEEFDLRVQLRQLAKDYFPRMTKTPKLKIQRLGDEEYEDAPAWLNALRGIVYIDERVYTFQEKLTKILILHELIHYQLYLESPIGDQKTCAVKVGAFQWEVAPPGNWFVPPSSNRSGDGGNEVVRAFGEKGRFSGSASMQVVI